mgnify:CR=1 FL=1
MNLRSSENPQMDMSGDRLAGPSLDNEQMYRLPGNESLTPKDLQRYRESVKQLQKTINETGEDRFLAIEAALKGYDPTQREVALQHIGSVPKTKRAYLLEMGLNNISVGCRMVAIEHVQFVPIERRVDILERALGEKNSGVRLKAIKKIKTAPPENRADLLETALKDEVYSFRVLALKQLDCILPNRRLSILTDAINDPDPDVRSEAFRQMNLLPPEKCVALIEQGLKDQEPSVVQSSMKQISSLPQEERLRLVKKILGTKGAIILHDPRVRLIGFVPEDMRMELLKPDLESTNPLEKTHAYHLIWAMPEDQRVNLIRQGLKEPVQFVREAAIEQIQSAPEKSRVALIEEALHDPIQVNRIAALRQVVHIEQTKRRPLIDAVFADEHMHPGIEKTRFLEQISLPPEDDNARIKQLKDLAQTQPLYDDVKKRFFHRPFSKTGSGTTLLDIVPGNKDQSLREKIIIRHIPLFAFETWRQAYEASDAWKAAGFDYVPIEPIVKVATSSTSLFQVDVATRVLQAPSLKTWEQKTKLYVEDLDRQQQRILETLSTLGIEHGHPHRSNFVVLFERDADGQPNLEKPPRLYLIDFDQAVSSSGP